MSAEVEIIAHRGASGDAPENTLRAFELAWEQGADAIELDVHLTKDQNLVVIHDADTRRTTGATGQVRQQTVLALAQLDAGVWKHAKFRGLTIPLLADVLSTVPEGRRIFIEVKGGVECLGALESILTGSPLQPSQTALITFDFDSAKAMRERFPDRETGWNIDRPWKAPRLEKILERAQEARLSALSFSNDWSLTPELVERFHAAGFRVHVWTVDDVLQARRLIEAGVNGVMTNFPGRIIQGWLKGQTPATPSS